MIECKKRDINEIYEWYEKYADEDAKRLIGTQPDILQVAYYTPSQANWSYKVGLVEYAGNVYEVITVFGEVKAARLANLPKYNKDNLEKRRY